jgi:hypothetical protein
MENDEARMTNDEGMAKISKPELRRQVVRHLGILSSFDIGH